MLKLSAGLVLLVLSVTSVLWHTCGLKGCPEVDTLRGYLPDEASVILDRDGQEAGKLFVTRRVIVSLDSLPAYVPAAFVAMEDRRFWQHRGVDWRRVLAAAWRNLKSWEIEEGSSTITMQLARNVFPDALPAHQKTLWRKIAEARVARDIERQFSKEDILELYLNQIYFGNGAHGIEAAAHEYFGKRAAELTLAEAGLLAALPRAPARLNPRNNPERALAGRKVVLERMRDQGRISASAASAAIRSKLRLRHGELRTREEAPYFIEAVRRVLEERLGDAVYREGYTIHTTLDTRAQRIAEEELRTQMRDIEAGRYGRYRHATYAAVQRETAQDLEGTKYLQAAVVIMEPSTGDVIALIGGRDFQDSQFNRATQAARQPGSAFKPFVYAAAIAAGYPPSHRLVDRPFRLALGAGRSWEPKNYDGAYAGMVTLRDAFTYSKNTATVRLALEVGIDRVAEMAHEAGLPGRIPRVPAIVLGAAEVTPLDLTAAYATFATLGQHPRPRLITKVVDRAGHIVWSQEPALRRTIDPAVAYLVMDLMKDVIQRGTGTAVRAVGFDGVAAGKTGTTNDAADVWFVGFTPRRVGTIWMGFDQRKTVLRGATGGELAAPVWGRIMKRIDESAIDWTQPPGIEVHRVDDQARVISELCPVHGLSRTEYFLAGTAPVDLCSSDPWITEEDALDASDSLVYREGWWRRIRRRLAEPDSLPADRPADPAADSVRADTTPLRLLGRPVLPERPRPDSINRIRGPRAPASRDDGPRSRHERSGPSHAPESFEFDTDPGEHHSGSPEVPERRKTGRRAVGVRVEDESQCGS